MTLKRISKDYMKQRWPIIYANHQVLCDSIAQAQLETDQKALDKIFNPDWLQTKEHYEQIIRDLVKEHTEAHNAVVREILSFIESYLVTTIEADGVKMHHIDESEWQSVKQRCLKIGGK